MAFAIAALPRNRSASLFVAELVQPLVDRNIDAADEDAGDAGDLGDVAAGPLQILKPGNIGVDHLS